MIGVFPPAGLQSTTWPEAGSPINWQSDQQPEDLVFAYPMWEAAGGALEEVISGARTAAGSGAIAYADDHDMGRVPVFNGTNTSYQMAAPAPPEAQVIGDIALMAWVRPATVASGALQILVADDGFGNGGSWIDINRTAAKVTCAWNGTIIGNSNRSLTANDLFHVGWQRWGKPGAWNWEIYVNGILDNSGSTSTNPAAGQFKVWLIGQILSLQFFNGRMRDVRCYNRRLSPAAWASCGTLDTAANLWRQGIIVVTYTPPGASFVPWGNMASFDAQINEPCRVLAY